MITLEEFLSVIETPGKDLNRQQRQAVEYANGPMWIIAGPGTGKTHVLCLLTLKLVCCDEVDPSSILLTTFTRKAANQLIIRIATIFNRIIQAYPERLSQIDINRIHINTLDSIIVDILQRQRVIEYQNVKLIDEIQTKLFINDYITRYISKSDVLEATFRNCFNWLDFGDASKKWIISKNLYLLFSKIVSECIDLHDLLSSDNEGLRILGYQYQKYQTELRNHNYITFDQQQLLFLNFLQSPQSCNLFVDRGFDQKPLQYILVDEYQDTNPLQERIYFSLARMDSHNLVVVGDDDQALYRFRGGTVDCMVNFESHVRREYPDITVSKIELNRNYRSRKSIVDFCNSYITGFNFMQIPGARVENKAHLINNREDAHNFSVSYIQHGGSLSGVSNFAQLVFDLKRTGKIEDYNQCVLLLSSARDNDQNAGPFISALRQYGINIYNPRSDSFSEYPHIQQLIATITRIIDCENERFALLVGRTGQPIQRYLSRCSDALDLILPLNPDLSNYIQHSISNIRRHNIRSVLVFNEIVSRIMTLEPFATYMNNPNTKQQLSLFTRILDSFTALNGRYLTHRDPVTQHLEINTTKVDKFFYSFVGYIFYDSVYEDEDEEYTCPPGYFPIMTVHQAKGLEFDFVFVDTIGRNPLSSRNKQSSELDILLIQNRLIHRDVVFSINDSTLQDQCRWHFVAYSRAKHVLVLLPRSQQDNSTISFGPEGRVALRRSISRL